MARSLIPSPWQAGVRAQRRGTGRAKDARRLAATRRVLRQQTPTMGQTAGAEVSPEDDDEEPRIHVNPTENSLVSNTQYKLTFDVEPYAT